MRVQLRPEAAGTAGRGFTIEWKSRGRGNWAECVVWEDSGEGEEAQSSEKTRVQNTALSRGSTSKVPGKVKGERSGGVLSFKFPHGAQV